jgi:acyl-homoserine lactone acylase PvdQ
MPRQEHYTDLIDLWLKGEYVDVYLDRADLGDVQELQLVPAD